MSEDIKNEEQMIEVPEKFKNLVALIEGLSVLDLSELVKILEKKFGVSAAPVVTMGGAMMGVLGAQGIDASLPEEKTSFNVELTASGANKIGVIKAVREMTQLGLKEAKDLVDGAPKMIKENVSKEEAESMQKKFEEAGATVALK